MDKNKKLKLESGLFRAMKIFLCVVNSGSFTTAAQQCNLTTSQVSRAIKDLEERLSTRLLYRSTRNLSVTDIGKWYSEQCKNILDLTLQAEQSIAFSASNPKGRVKVSSMNNFGSHYLYSLIIEFQKKHPEIIIDYSESNEFPEIVRKGIDSGIFIDKSLPDSSLKAKKIGEAFSIICATHEYINMHNPITSPECLKRHPLLSINNSTSFSYWQLYSGSQSLKIHPQNILTSTNPELIYKSVLNNLGIALLPFYTVVDAFRNGKLIRILPTWESNHVNIYQITPSGSFINEATSTWNRFISEELPKKIEHDLLYF